MAKLKAYKNGDLECTSFVEDSAVTKESFKNTGVLTAKQFVEDNTISMPLKFSATQCIIKGQFIEPEIIYDIDNNAYTVVKIGTQEWLQQNLKTVTYNDGSAITNVTGNAAWAALTTEAYCWYNNDAAYKTAYGALYNWYAVNTGKLAPTGWKVCSDEEFKILERFLGMTKTQSDAISERGTTEGGKLKEIGTTYWQNPNTGANNLSGFALLPGSVRAASNGAFAGIYQFGEIWTTLEYNAGYAWRRYTTYLISTIYRDRLLGKSGGLSVRCLRTYPTTPLIDAHLKFMKDFYTANIPTYSETWLFNTSDYGYPTGGNSNVDIVAIKALFTSAGFTATITVNV